MAGASLPTNRLGWRVYICGRGFDFYAYTIIGTKGEHESVDAVLEFMGMVGLRCVTKVVTVDLSEFPADAISLSSTGDYSKESENH